MSLRIAVGVSWARVDSSIARNGPISFPLLTCQLLAHRRHERATSYLGLITPNMLAATKTQKFPLMANTTPLALINPAPNINIRRLPNPSATRVRRKLMTTSPSSVNVMKSPILASDVPRLERYSANIRVVAP